VKQGWQRRRLDDVSAISYGYTQSASTDPIGPRFLRITDIQGDRVDWGNLPYCAVEPSELPRYQLRKGDIVFARTGATTGKSFLVDAPPTSVFASYLIRLRLTEPTLLPEFVSLFFQTREYWKAIKDGSSGSAQGGFNATKLGALTLPCPPAAEQRRIVGILDEAFASIATAKANAEKSLLNARVVFASHLETTFGSPRPGWVARPVSELAQHSLGKMLDRAKNRGERRPYLRNINVRWFAFDLSDLLEMPFLPEEAGRCTAVRGDVLMCEGGYPGRAAIWSEDAPVYFQKALHRIRFHAPEHNKWFVYYLYSQDASGRLRARFSGAGIQHFTGEALARFPVPVPPLPELRRAVETMDALRGEVTQLELLFRQKAETLDTLKQSLLHQAFAGEL